MSVYYDLYQNPPQEGEQDERLHARVLPKGTIPADKFMEIVHNATGFSQAILDGTLQASPYISHSGLTEEQRLERLLKHMDENGCITRADYAELVKCSKAQACSDLNRCIEQGIIRKYGSGRTVVYLKP